MDLNSLLCIVLFVFIITTTTTTIQLLIVIFFRLAQYHLLLYPPKILLFFPFFISICLIDKVLQDGDLLNTNIIRIEMHQHKSNIVSAW